MLVASVLAPAAVLGLFAWHSYHQIVHGAQDRAQRFATVVQEHTLKVFETIGLVLQAADQRLRGADLDALPGSKEIWDELRRLQQSSEQMGSIFVVDRHGFGSFTTRAFPSPVVDFSDRDYYFEQRRANQGLYVGQSYVGKISSDQIFNFSIRRTSEDGRFDGVIGVSAYVHYFEKYYRSIGVLDDGFAIALVKDDGNILVRYPALGTGSSKVPDDNPFLQNLRAADHGTFFARSPFNGLDRLYGYVKVRGFPIYAVYGIDQRAITAEWLETVYQAAALAFVVGFCMFVTAWFALRRAKQEALALRNLRQATAKLEQEIERRERAEASLLQTQRLEAIGQLTGGIAHDFNNLLTVISGNLDLADRRSDLGSVRRLLKSVRYASERAASLTRQLLAFSRRHMLNPRTVDINGVLERTRVLIEHSIPENIRLEFALQGDPHPARIDVSEFEAAVLNVVVNARDAMPSGGNAAILRARRGARRRRWWRQRAAGHARPPCRGAGRGHRLRHVAGDAGPRLRAVLHHQGGRQRDRPWIEPGLRLRAAIGRFDLNRQRARSRDPGIDIPAALVRGDRRQKAATRSPPCRGPAGPPPS